MSYTIKDILERLINLEEEMAIMYEDLSNNSNISMDNIKILAKVMSKEENRHALYFRNIKATLSTEEKNLYVDVFTYDKVSQLMYEFKRKAICPNRFDKISNFLNFILNFERENLALLIDIRGRLVRSLKDIESYNYIILSELIEEEKKHIHKIENLSKNS